MNSKNKPVNSNRRTILFFKRIKKMNFSLLWTLIAILGISLCTIYSASVSKTSAFLYKEIVWIMIGSIVYLFTSLVHYRTYKNYSRLLYIGTIFMLLMVTFFGTYRLGAKRWLNLGLFTIQPSEFAKVLLVLTFSAHLIETYDKKRFGGFKKLFKSFMYILPIFVLIAKQPDLGTSITILFLYGTLVLMYDIDWRTIISVLIPSTLSLPLIFKFGLKEYQQKRVLTFLHPETDILGSGWNVIQSMIAVGSGSKYGKGFLQGSQSKLRFLPEAHTDFIGAVFFEEFGFAGAVILLGLYFLLIMQICNIGSAAEDEYGKMICYGIASILLFHVLVNIGMITGIMPVTGLPLIFMSYGGSSLVLGCAMIGIVQSVKIYRD